ncbi:hypothetical protein AS189_16430 [Arthrobacter alpinus]|uniref:Membrane protein involved in the export of O-antigen and teichoic acid n=1 Tax=Arthrobacter alpinus TaxID=656366 RepID=A0A0S2M249_9MICC|nr:hypothetical protein [Arthrobacter alpinus]ALO67775.1 hypothetical protein AS189_16430 [Arthrobacter alpinus]
MTHRRKSVALGFVDQAISSLTTLLLLIAAAQWLTPSDLGRFAIGVATIAPCVSIIRALCGETLIVKVTSLPHRFRESRHIQREAQKMLGLALLLAFAAVVLILLVSVFWNSARDILLASAVAVVGVVLQDAVRHYLLTARKSILLLSGDFFVLLFAVGGIYYVGSTGYQPPAMILVWGATAFIAAMAALSIDRMVPRIFSGYKWLRFNWSNSSAFVMEATLGAIVGYLVVVILSVFSSDTEVAAFRTAVSVFGVTSLVINFLRTAVLRELTPDKLRTSNGILRTCLQMSVLVFATVLATVIVVYFLPESVGALILGESWPLVVALASIAAINRLAAGLSIAPLIVLRVQGVSWPATRIRIGATFVALALSPMAAYLAGAAGALAADTVFYAIVTIFLLRLALKNANLQTAPSDHPLSIEEKTK